MKCARAAGGEGGGIVQYKHLSATISPRRELIVFRRANHLPNPSPRTQVRAPTQGIKLSALQQYNPSRNGTSNAVILSIPMSDVGQLKYYHVVKYVSSKHRS